MWRTMAVVVLLSGVCPAIGAEPGKAVEPLASYRGIVHLDLVIGELNEKFDAVSVIRDDKAYRDFIAKLPANQVTKTGGELVANADPLRDRPEIDFQRAMLIVLRRRELAPPVIRRVTLQGDRLVVAAEFPEDFSARPLGTGSYAAIVVPRSKAKVQLEQFVARP